MRAPVLISILTAAAVLAAGAAWACSCVGYRSAEAQLAETPLMFVGRAVRTVPEAPRPDTTGRPAPAPPQSVTRFQVERTLKGRAQAVRRIAHHAGDGAGCGVQFTPGRTYVVMARASEGRLTTNLCSQPQFPLADYERALAGG